MTWVHFTPSFGGNPTVQITEKTILRMQHGGGSIMWCVALGLLVVSLTNSLFTQLLILLYGLFISLQHQPPHARLSLSELMLKKS